MAVTFTTNLGLAKPDETELAANWIDGTQLDDDNNTIIEAATNIAFSSYTPTIICNTTNPNVGAGFIHAEYQTVGKYVFGNVILFFLDPGVSAGSGTGGYGISLPVLADTSFHTAATALTDVPGVASCIGEAQIIDGSTVASNQTCCLDLAAISGTHYVRLVTETFAAKTNALFIPGQPFTIATNDRISLQFFYKKP